MRKKTRKYTTVSQEFCYKTDNRVNLVQFLFDGYTESIDKELGNKVYKRKHKKGIDYLYLTQTKPSSNNKDKHLLHGVSLLSEIPPDLASLESQTISETIRLILPDQRIAPYGQNEIITNLGFNRLSACFLLKSYSDKISDQIVKDLSGSIKYPDYNPNEIDWSSLFSRLDLPTLDEVKDQLQKLYLIVIQKKEIHEELSFLWESGHYNIEAAYIENFTKAPTIANAWLLALDHLDTEVPSLAWKDTHVFYFIGNLSATEVFIEYGFSPPMDTKHWLTFLQSENTNRGINSHPLLLVYGDGKRLEINVSAKDFQPIISLGNPSFGNVPHKESSILPISSENIPEIKLAFGLRYHDYSRSEQLIRRRDNLQKEINYIEHELDSLIPFQVADKGR